jgi:type IV fimbrial biogenesis protein FimT
MAATSPLPTRARLPGRRAAGFTLTELLIVVAIMGIVAAIAAPNMADMIRTQRLRTASFDIFAALNLARSEAIKRNVSVTITPLGADWAAGWVTRDSNGNVLQQQEPYNSCSTCSLAGPANVIYASSGRITSAAPQFSVTASNLDSSKYRCIRVELSGRPVTTQGSC